MITINTIPRCFTTDAIIPIIMSAVTAGIFGALKYYSNTLGSNPEGFVLRKFAPIVIISIIVSVGFAITSGSMSADSMVDYISANFILVVFANTVLSIIEKKFNINI